MWKRGLLRGAEEAFEFAAKGGFLMVEVLSLASNPELKFTFHDVDGNPVYVCQKEYME